MEHTAGAADLLAAVRQEAGQKLFGRPCSPYLGQKGLHQLENQAGRKFELLAGMRIQAVLQRMQAQIVGS